VKDGTRPRLGEVLVAWGLYAVVAVEVLVTYARLPAEQLYNVSGSGLESGAGRTLVFLGYPTSLAVIAFLPVLVERLAHPLATLTALGSFGLCLTIGIPGVLEETDLDAKPANVLAGIGVGLALLLTVVALAHGGLGMSAPFGDWDWARMGLALVLLLASFPWLAAELGFHAGGPVFLSEELRPEPGHPTIRAVHLGHHHGMDGVLLAWTALLVSRVVVRMRSVPLRRALTAYLSLMLVYGLANALQDFWLEQLVKRGATELRLPSMLRPEATPAWAAVLAVAGAIYVALSRVDKVQRRPPRRFE
jgi:hypothetical protein